MISINKPTPAQQFALNILSGTALVLAAGWFSYNVAASRNNEVPPRIVHSITLDPTILLAGQQFTAHFQVTLNRLCPYEVHWSLVRKGDNVEVVKIIEPVKQPPATTGDQELQPAKRYVPSGMAPGEYYYSSEVFDLCADKTYTTVRKSVDISIR